MKLEVLHIPDCPNLATLLDRLREVTDLPIVTHQIDTEEGAIAWGMAGSPTLLVNRLDPFAGSDQRDLGLSCRLYRDTDGQLTGAPTVQQLRDALRTAGPVDVLSTWRTSATPLEPVERAVHQAVLRAFAATGRAPVPRDLDGVLASTGTDAGTVVRRLHDLDAIRLAPDGTIAVAYPFSATPTRHLVRIGNQIDVYAMCAIDALGIAAMLGQDTAITSVDVSSGQSVIVNTTGERTVWEPADAVVFIGAERDGGPSADYCCDYVNFFTDTAAAEAWSNNHPQVHGQVLSQTEAEQLGIRLFQPLLAN
jgi:hypothetical protein